MVLGHMNIHPPLSSFPGVILTLVVVAELYAAFRKSAPAAQLARTLLTILLFIAPLTYFSGYVGEEYAKHVDKDVIGWHENFAKLFLLSLVSTGIFAYARTIATTRANLIGSFYYLLLSVTYGLILYVSFLGGGIVFEHGGGVNPKILQPTSDPSL